MIRVTIVDEPPEIELRFRSRTRRRQPATKDRADSFLVGIRDGRAAEAGNLRPRPRGAKAKSTILLASNDTSASVRGRLTQTLTRLSKSGQITQFLG
jgi:hypothetical protein